MEASTCVRAQSSFCIEALLPQPQALWWVWFHPSSGLSNDKLTPLTFTTSPVPSTHHWPLHSLSTLFQNFQEILLVFPRKHTLHLLTLLHVYLTPPWRLLLRVRGNSPCVTVGSFPLFPHCSLFSQHRQNELFSVFCLKSFNGCLPTACKKNPNSFPWPLRPCLELVPACPPGLCCRHAGFLLIPTC